MARATQRVFKFNNKNNADKFSNWLKANQGDSDYGYPVFINQRQFCGDEWIVECSSENVFLINGIAIGANL